MSTFIKNMRKIQFFFQERVYIQNLKMINPLTPTSGSSHPENRLLMAGLTFQLHGGFFQMNF